MSFSAASLTYLGGIRTPHEMSTDVTPLPGAYPPDGETKDGMNYSGKEFALDCQRQEFLIGTRYWRIARLALIEPALEVDGDVNTFPIAPYVAPTMVEVSGPPQRPESPTTITPIGQSYFEMDKLLDPYGCELHGILPVGDTLLVNGAKYFDSGNTTRRAFFACDWPPAGAAADYRPNRTPFKALGNELEQGWMAGGMCPIPAGYQAALKGDVLSGNSNLPIISRGSQGPCATSFWAADVRATDPIPCTTLVGYPGQHFMPESPWNSVEPDDIYNQNTLINGVAIVGDTVVFIGSHGYGPACYGIGSANPEDHEQDINGEHFCYDPAVSNHGTHAYPYRIQVWHYPVADLIRVANGECAPWDLRPEWFELTVPFHRSDYVTGPCAFDEATGRLYVSVYAADGYGGEPGPVIYVWQYDGAAAPPVTPPADCTAEHEALAAIHADAAVALGALRRIYARSMPNR